MRLEMPPSEALTLCGLFEMASIRVWLDGGWGVDALLGEQTRPHADLDIFMDAGDVSRMRGLLESRGYADVLRDDTSAWNFVRGDGAGHEVDVHVFTTDRVGNRFYGPPDHGEH